MDLKFYTKPSLYPSNLMKPQINTNPKFLYVLALEIKLHFRLFDPSFHASPASPQESSLLRIVSQLLHPQTPVPPLMYFPS
jgi:hypothetical protein